MKLRPKTYLYDEKHSDDEDIALAERRPKKVQHFVEADVRDDDTLQAIALRFNCSVASLKSVNNIHKENEIFAKGKLKIPVAAFSLFTEAIPAVHTSGTNSPTRTKELVATLSSSSSSDLQQKLIVAAVNSSEIRRPTGSVDVAVEPPDHIIDDDDSTPLMAVESERRRRQSAGVAAVVVSEFENGIDIGIKWYHLLAFLAVIVVVPLVYVLYIAEHPEKFHEHHS